MSNDVIRILPGAVLILVGLCWMWRLHGSNRRHVAAAAIGCILAIVGWSLMRVLPDQFDPVAIVLLVGGAVIGIMATYKNYKYRTSLSSGEKKKKR